MVDPISHRPGALSPTHRRLGTSPALGEYSHHVAPVSPVSPTNLDRPYDAAADDALMKRATFLASRSFVEARTKGLPLTEDDRALISIVAERLSGAHCYSDEYLFRVADKISAIRRGEYIPLVQVTDKIVRIQVDPDLENSMITFATNSGEVVVGTHRPVEVVTKATNDTRMSFGMAAFLDEVLRGLPVAASDRVLLGSLASSLSNAEGEAIDISRIISDVARKIGCIRRGELAPHIGSHDEVVLMSLHPDRTTAEILFATRSGTASASTAYPYEVRSGAIAGWSESVELQRYLNAKLGGLPLTTADRAMIGLMVQYLGRDCLRADEFLSNALGLIAEVRRGTHSAHVDASAPMRGLLVKADAVHTEILFESAATVVRISGR